VAETSSNSSQYLTVSVQQPFSTEEKRENRMKNTKFIVKVDRGGTRVPEYVQRIDVSPIQTTPHRKLALLMGRFTAEDAINSIQTSRCSPELVCVRVSA
jgi:hypothetical protein